MRKLLAVIAAVPLFALVAGATDYSKYEVFLGYNFVRFNPNSDFVPSFNANGGGGQFAYNLNRWFSGVVDIGAVTKGTLNGFNIDTTVMNFVAGPRFTYRKHGRFIPYAQVLFGGAYSTASAPIVLTGGEILPPILVTPANLSARLVASHTGFAMFAGGGLDIKINKHMSFRPVGADYYLTRVSNVFTSVGDNTSNRNNFRYSAGVNFMFGAR
jgi:hypothetical protein